MKLKSNQISHLRSLAHKLKPVVIIGGNGLTDNVLTEISEQLDHHELIKVRINAEDRDDRKLMIEEISKKTQATLVQSIGHIGVFYKTAKKPIINLPA